MSDICETCDNTPDDCGCDPDECEREAREAYAVEQYEGGREC